MYHALKRLTEIALVSCVSVLVIRGEPFNASAIGFFTAVGVGTVTYVLTSPIRKRLTGPR